MKIDFSKNNDTIIRLFKRFDGNITKTAQALCGELYTKYHDGIRRMLSFYLRDISVIKDVDEQDAMDIAKCRKLMKSKYYIITSEQNNTPLHQPFLDNVLAYKRFLNAELSIILTRYKNPTSIFSDRNFDVWSDSTRQYWDAKRHNIHKYVSILGDIKIQPTATKPLESLENISGVNTAIIGHPALHMKVCPVFEGSPKKVMMTTGSISIPNYTDTKAGKRSEYNHKNGFVIIEIKNDEVFFIRQVEADIDGNFIDLFYSVKNGLVSEINSAKAIVWGDTHIQYLRDDLKNSTNKLINRLNIPIEVHHDIFDGESVNNHIENDPFAKFERYNREEHLIWKEVETLKNFISENPKTKKIIVQSNHNDRLDRYLAVKDWRDDLPNAITQLEYSLVKLKGLAPNGIIAYILDSECENVKCLGLNDSYIIGGYELANHGHIGANGSKGTMSQYRKLNQKIVTAHSHTPARDNNAICVGTSTKLRLSYNSGMSGWLNCHFIIHNNNIGQQLIFIDGEYTTFK